MDRSNWLKEIRQISEQQETLLAPVYDEHWGDVSPLHQQCYERFLSLCPPGSRLLDAACGTGKYWSLILASGRTVFGIDQSQGALLRAHEKFPNVTSQKLGLQEMSFNETFSGASCMDALELVCPEDWPLVMRNLSQAITANSYLYFTVELTDEREIQAAFAEGQQMNLPVIYGEAEWLQEGGYHWSQGGYYHYYPRMEQVREWVRLAGFRLAEERNDAEYHHFLVQKV